MPVDHALVKQNGSRGEDGELFVNKGARTYTQQKGERSKQSRIQGIPIDLNDASTSLLSPILSHLPSLAGLGSTKVAPPPISHEGLGLSIRGKACWAKADLGDGYGKGHLLLVSSPTLALQIFRFTPSTPPDDPHVKEVFPAPEEIFNLPTIKTDSRTARSSVTQEPEVQGEEQVIQACLMTGTALWRRHGPVTALLTSTRRRKTSSSAMSVVVVSMESGTAIHRCFLGCASAARLSVSARAIVVSLSCSSPVIHVLDSETLQPIQETIFTPPSSARTPPFALSGRLLAYATSTPPPRPGPDGLGQVVTAKTSRHDHRSTPTTVLSSSQQVRSASDSSQTALLSSAVEIGGAVARGVWAGLKMGARAANQARNNRLARSAPTDSPALAEADDDVETGSVEARSMEESSVLEEPVVSPARAIGGHGGEWVKVIDLRPGSGKHATVVAHFRMPPARSVAPIPSDTRLQPGGGASSAARVVAHLSFNSVGTQLLAAPEDGRVCHIFDLHPASDRSLDATGHAWHLYELRRGNTAGTICGSEWSKDGRWVGLSTAKGTIHVFPINPTGGAPAASTHVTAGNTNPQRLSPLSTIVPAAARVRVHPEPHAQTSLPGAELPGVPLFAHVRSDPLHREIFLQDVAIFRPTTAQLEIARLRLSKADSASAHVVPGQRRASALTEMMRAKAGFGEGSDLEVAKAVKAKWLIPLDDDHEVLLRQIKEESRPRPAGSYLAHAEIQTHCLDTRILPGPVYLSRQIDFFSARPIDDFSPLSIMDAEARVKRLLFRPEVQARSTSPEVSSFDEPIMSALHSVIETPAGSQIPGLPNGYPSSPRWKNIPIRQVAAGLGEGVDRVRREYVRAQHSRAKRRASEAAQIGLSFEDETVFPTMTHDDDDAASSPSSVALPATNTESSAEGDAADDEEWGQGWEEEYAKAVEDDGGPEELVLGLMDEEEEERRSWAVKQKQQQKQKYRP